VGAELLGGEWLLLGIGVVLTIGTGLFVASEFALVNLDRSELEARRERGETRLGMTIAALRSPRRTCRARSSASR
jgi:CBS domain containing-hemolysin-like protein